MSRGPVVPRALSPECGYPFAIEDLVEPYVGRDGTIAILGPYGYDKRYALARIREAFPDTRILDSDFEVVVDEGPGLRVYARESELRTDHLATLRMAPWGQDEILEYLMAEHPSRCAAVMDAVRADDAGKDRLRGCPELWRAVLDRMAGADPVPPIGAVLADLARASSGRLGRHPPVRVVRVARRLAESLEAGNRARLRAVPDDVLAEAARWLSAGAEGRLRVICDGPDDPRQAVAASLLVAMGSSWIPRGSCPVLRGARLAGAKWGGARLGGGDLSGADLRNAILDRADLAGASMGTARLRRAKLRRACLTKATLSRSDLRGADLTGARAGEALFFGARLARANLERAEARDAVFLGTDARGARFVGADLRATQWVRGRLAGADFSDADLMGADLRGLDLRRATWSGARFARAHLDLCNLEGMRLAGADFEGARLRGAHLTGSRMPEASFRGANLEGAGLAEVEWEGVDLRDANLRSARFHMGSTRDGLVDSPIACEGSRTGYYTDDYDEQTFKSPEEIRKANLRGADLRGADVRWTDFYLVDLRDARYTADQELHFRRTGAILETKRL